MSKYTITPWRTPEDLWSVRTQLYRLDPAAPDTRRQAVDRVLAWKLRGNLPHAVESTALLTDAVLHHAYSHSSAFSVRAVYSAAFCRFVTGFCDIGRSRDRALAGLDGGQSSMLEIARQIGMPPDFVALRHEATHEELPSVARLKAAVARALDWLNQVYWRRLQEPRGIEPVKEVREASWENAREEVCKALKEYRRARRETVKAKRQSSRVRSNGLVKESDALTTLGDGNKARAEAVSEVLVDEKLLFPSNRELGAPMDGAFALWDDLLSSISASSSTFLPTLNTCLLNRLTADPAADHANDAESEAITLWLLHIVDRDNEPSAELLRSQILRHCCLHPGYWTARLGSEVLQRANDEFIGEWEDLFDAAKLQDGLGSGSSSDQVAGRRSGKVDELEFLEDAPVDHIIAETDRQLHEMGSDSEVEAGVGGWRRMVFKPRVAIGVVP